MNAIDDEAADRLAYRQMMERRVVRLSRNPVRVIPVRNAQGREEVLATTVFGRGERVHTRAATTTEALASLEEMLKRRNRRQTVRPPRRG